MQRFVFARRLFICFRLTKNAADPIIFEIRYYTMRGAIFLAKVTFLKEICKGCSLCVTACPKHIIALSDAINAKGYNYAVLTDEAACIGCASCARMCPDCVITVEK